MDSEIKDKKLILTLDLTEVVLIGSMFCIGQESVKEHVLKHPTMKNLAMTMVSAKMNEVFNDFVKNSNPEAYNRAKNMASSCKGMSLDDLENLLNQINN